MAKSILSSSGDATLSSTAVGFAWTNNTSIVETNIQNYIGLAGNIDDFRVGWVNTTGTSRICTLRKNAVDTSLVCSLANGSSGNGGLATGAVAFAAGDLVTMNYAGASSPSPGNPRNASFSATVGTTYYLLSFGGVAVTVGIGVASPHWTVPWGATQNTSALNPGIVCRGPGTWNRLSVNVTSHGANTLTIATEINGVTGNVNVSFGSSVSGRASDTSNSDTVADGDVIRYVHSRTSTAAYTIQVMTSAITCSSGALCDLGIEVNANSVTSQTYGITGGGTGATVITWAAPFAMTFRRFRTNIKTNTKTGTTTHQVLINSSNGNQSFSFGAAVTGNFEDTTHTDSVAVGDIVQYSQSGGTTGTSTPTWGAITYQDNAFTPAGKHRMMALL